MSVTVALSTSSHQGSIAIAIDGVCRYGESIQKGMVHGREIVRRFQSAFADLDLEPAAIDLVVCDIGPGSYTGMRVGVTTAKTLAFACEARVVGVLGVDAIARNLERQAGSRTVLIDAKRHEVYVTSYEPRADSDALRCTWPIEIVRCDEVVATLEAGHRILGDGIPTVNEALGAAGFEVSDESNWYPHAEQILQIGLAAAAESGGDDAETLLPYYLRSSEPVMRKPSRSAAP